MNLIYGVGRAILAVHSYKDQHDVMRGLMVAGYVPIVGTVAAVARAAILTFSAWKEDEGVGMLGMILLLFAPRSLFEATGLGWCLIPVDLTVTAVHALFSEQTRYSAELLS